MMFIFGNDYGDNIDPCSIKNIKNGEITHL